MYQINIENFGPVEKGSLQVEKISLVCGGNMAGKSNICDAVASALVANIDPLDLQKNEIGQVIRTGSDSAFVTVTNDNGSVSATFPDCKFTPAGEQPVATLYATGHKSILGMKEVDKASALQEYLKTLPTVEDLTAALKRFKIDIDTSRSIWTRIGAGGWDKAHEYYCGQGRQLKAQWLATTNAGGTYGGPKAAGWLPRGWESDLEGASIETLKDELAREREMLESLLKYEAVNEKEVNDLRETYLGLDQAQKDHAEHVRLLADKKKAAVEADKALSELRRPEKKQKTVACLHCKKDLVIHGEALELPRVVSLTDDEIAMMEAAIKEAQGVLTEARAAVDWQQSAIAEAKQRINGAEQADLQLKEIASRDQKTKPPAAQVEAQRKACERADSRLEAAGKKRGADQINQSITLNQFVIDVLAPDGLRAEKLSGALADFNASLAKLCESARLGDIKWGDVNIGNDLRISIGNKAKRLSKSQKYRLRVTLQVAFAQLDRSVMLVVDEADMLDPAGRSGLFTMLQECAIPALVAMTAVKDVDIINLAKHGIGTTYVLKDNVVHELKVKEAVTA